MKSTNPPLRTNPPLSTKKRVRGNLCGGEFLVVEGHDGEARPQVRVLDVPAQLDRLFRGGLVFKVHRLLHHSTLGLRVIKNIYVYIYIYIFIYWGADGPVPTCS